MLFFLVSAWLRAKRMWGRRRKDKVRMLGGAWGAERTRWNAVTAGCSWVSGILRAPSHFLAMPGGERQQRGQESWHLVWVGKTDRRVRLPHGVLTRRASDIPCLYLRLREGRPYHTINNNQGGLTQNRC